MNYSFVPSVLISEFLEMKEKKNVNHHLNVRPLFISISTLKDQKHTYQVLNLIWHLMTCQRLPIPSVVGGRLKSVIFPFGGPLMFLGGLLHFCKGLSKWSIHMGRPSDGCITSYHLGQPSHSSNAHIYGSYLPHNWLIKFCHNFYWKNNRKWFCNSRSNNISKACGTHWGKH